MIYTEGKRRLANFVAEVTPKLGFPGFCRNTFLNIRSNLEHLNIRRSLQEGVDSGKIVLASLKP